MILSFFQILSVFFTLFNMPLFKKTGGKGYYSNVDYYLFCHGPKFYWVIMETDTDFFVEEFNSKYDAEEFIRIHSDLMEKDSHDFPRFYLK